VLTLSNDGLNDKCQQNEAHKDNVEFVVSGEYAAIRFEPAKKPFNLVASFT
jgi:hypothetical protein